MTISRLMRSFSRWNSARIYKSNIPRHSAALDQKLKQEFCSEKPLIRRMKALTEYFVNSFIEHSNVSATRCYFIGQHSYNSRDMDAIEGCTRLLPFLASVAVSDIELSDAVNQKNALKKLVLALSNGTNPSSQGYWGDTEDYSQLICEAADVALSVWISRSLLVSKLNDAELNGLITWLKSAADKEIVDNNWHLFRLTIQLVVNHFDSTYQFDLESYQRIKSFYVGEGWFSDGEGQHYDYYNAWAFHYSLFWVSQIKPNLDPIFIRQANKEFCSKFKYFFSPKGVPFFGRSIGYRMAAPSPLIAACLLDSEADSASIASEAFDAIWKLFIGNDGIKDGVPTQGYFNADLRFLDEYSGPGSSLWSLRSLILALQLPIDSSFYDDISKQLPVQMDDFDITIDAIGLNISGVKESCDIIATWTNRKVVETAKADSFKLTNKFKEIITQRPQRPKNNLIKNGLSQYSVNNPYTRS